ncbi:MAG: RHS repeat-associated core domain-containing protein [Firmicutes bacterium]|nr:RHS repeat-associated core domain-containing protein [Bacillota bacterium]
MPTIERRYIVALGRYIARDEIVNGIASRVFYHGDHLGSTRVLSGSDSGNLIYDPFGNLVQITEDAQNHSHRFTGKPIDSTGLYYFGARFYDPTIGRFIEIATFCYTRSCKQLVKVVLHPKGIDQDCFFFICHLLTIDARIFFYYFCRLI